MVKKILLVLICLVSLVIFVSTLQGQGPKKTITLPNGEVVCDLNGEWDVFIERYGEWSQYGSYSDILKITQLGSSFVAIRMKGDPARIVGLLPGDEALRGELEKNGFKEVRIMSATGPLISKGHISDDGNKMVIDDGQRARMTLTRK
jgi:hypothetical protein